MFVDIVLICFVETTTTNSARTCQICLVLSALVAASLALPATPAGPAPATAPAAAAPAWRPSGRLLLLPARLENPTPTHADNNNNATKTQQVNKPLMFRVLTFRK